MNVAPLFNARDVRAIDTGLGLVDHAVCPDINFRNTRNTPERRDDSKDLDIVCNMNNFHGIMDHGQAAVLPGLEHTNNCFYERDFYNEVALGRHHAQPSDRGIFSGCFSDFTDSVPTEDVPVDSIPRYTAILVLPVFLGGGDEEWGDGGDADGDEDEDQDDDENDEDEDENEEEEEEDEEEEEEDEEEEEEEYEEEEEEEDEDEEEDEVEKEKEDKEDEDDEEVDKYAVEVKLDDEYEDWGTDKVNNGEARHGPLPIVLPPYLF